MNRLEKSHNQQICLLNIKILNLLSHWRDTGHCLTGLEGLTEMFGHRKHLWQDSNICPSTTTAYSYSGFKSAKFYIYRFPLHSTCIFSLCESEVRTVHFNAKLIILNDVILLTDEFLYVIQGRVRYLDTMKTVHAFPHSHLAALMPLLWSAGPLLWSALLSTQFFHKTVQFGRSCKILRGRFRMHPSFLCVGLWTLRCFWLEKGSPFLWTCRPCIWWCLVQVWCLALELEGCCPTSSVTLTSGHASSSCILLGRLWFYSNETQYSKIWIHDTVMRWGLWGPNSDSDSKFHFPNMVLLFMTYLEDT